MTPPISGGGIINTDEPYSTGMLIYSPVVVGRSLGGGIGSSCTDREQTLIMACTRSRPPQKLNCCWAEHIAASAAITATTRLLLGTISPAERTNQN